MTDAQRVTRYGETIRRCPATDSYTACMARQKSGAWVRHSDYAAIATARDSLQRRVEELTEALSKFVTAAKSWHEFHHGSETIQCDWLCECIAPGEAALASDSKEGR